MPDRSMKHYQPDQANTTLRTGESMKLWHERRFYSLDSYLKTIYRRKIYKISLDGGMSCPNRDGTLDTRGCIFCSAGGSGDFAASRQLTITEQIEAGKTQSARKFKPSQISTVPATAEPASVGDMSVATSTVTQPNYIAYFQAYTNTYAPVDYLRKIFTEAAMHPDIVLLSIATRPDCLSDEVLELLCEIQKIKPVWIELGLQTIHEATAAFIRRGYELSVFNEAVKQLYQRNIPTIVHTILGLPGETREHIIETIDYVCQQPIFGLKLQLLHVLKGTDLAEYYVNHPGLPDDKELSSAQFKTTTSTFSTLSQEDYVNLIVDILERIPDTITIHRMTGDAPKDLLIEPRWSLNKKQVLNDINRLLKQRNTWQGKNYPAD